MKIKNILVPVDFSECSKNALKFAIPLAKQFQAKIHMVNAVHVNSPHVHLVGGGIIDAMIADYEEQVKKSFDSLETEIIELKEVPHSADRFFSLLIDAIHSECEQKKIDLIVMGTRAEHDKLEKILGSHSSDVIDTAHVPVLVVPEYWMETKIEKIGLACKLEKINNVKRLKMLNSFAMDMNAEVLAFSVLSDPDSITLKEQKIYKEIVKAFNEGVATYRTYQSSEPIHGIKEFCHARGLDMLAFIPREKTFWQKLFNKSLSKSLLDEIDIPILSFRE